ncbi:MAG: hypothetical protein ACD_61C00172G0002 [uncultured bacterium]|nr:MAG: hypothetical protein ACD_61C00172G0002 [uncultured bacterium]
MFGNKKLTNMNDEERLLEVPQDEDESVGEVPGKNRPKRKKSKGERSADRKMVFWTLLIVLGITIFFWMWPKIKDFKFGLPVFNVGVPKVGIPKPEWKNYVEYKL